jgi:thymidylate kinase
MEQELTYLSEKKEILSQLKDMGCNLLRDDGDIDFSLINMDKKEDIYRYLSKKDFVCTGKDTIKMNFKKFINSKVVDIDIEMSTKYLNALFYDIDIKKDFEILYFNYPQNYQTEMNTLRYFMLLRGNGKKYSDFFYQHEEEIYNNNYFLKYLTKNPFKREVDFDTFMKVVKMDRIALIKNLKIKYVFYFVWLKIKYLFFKKRGKIVSLEGVDGAGKSTIIEILSKELQKPYFYMGERGFKYDYFYNSQKSIFLKPIAYFMRNGEKLYRYLVVYKASKSHSIVFTDRYHRFSKTAHNYKILQYLDKIFFFFYLSADISVVLWNTSDIILSRKQEVSKLYIEEFNKNKERDFPNAIFIKNDDIDTTLNKILRAIYA